MKIHNCSQQTDEWYKVRAGRPTASQFSRIVTATGKDSSQWHDYATDLVAECIRPDEIGFYGTKDTDRGNELEPEARDLFAERMDLEVAEVGFVTRDDGIVGCSPDFLIYRDGEPIAGGEIKSPRAGKHARYFLAGELPDEHRVQVHGGMAVTGLDYWYFMSYCPGMQPLIVRVERDEFTEKLADALDRFLIFYSAHRSEILPKLTGKGAGA